MKSFFTLLCLFSVATFSAAFAPLVPSMTTRGPQISSHLFSEPVDAEEDGLDLNLEEMFEMFDAADSGEKFDEAIKKVKTDK